MDRRMKYALLGVGVIISLTFIILTMQSAQQGQNKDTLAINGVVLHVERADTKEKQIQGLSQRESLKENVGMLFVYEKAGSPGIWMKDMHFPIDIIWINEEAKIVEIHENVSPDTYPTTFHASVPVTYVLEVNAGWAKNAAVKVGDKVEL